MTTATDQERASSFAMFFAERAVTARYLLDRSEAETATTLGIAPGTVKSSLARGLDKLRQFDRTDMAA